MFASDDLTEDYFNNYLNCEYVPLFTRITRPNPLNISRGSCIDNVFYKGNLSNISAIKYTQVLTDHYPLLVIFDSIDGKRRETERVDIINYKKMQNLSRREN